MNSRPASRDGIDVLALFRRAAQLITERSFPDATNASTMAELGIDSITMAHIIATIEDELEIEISGPHVGDISTIGGLADLVHELLEAKPSGRGPKV